jgi:hypothetical protein
LTCLLKTVWRRSRASTEEASRRDSEICQSETLTCSERRAQLTFLGSHGNDFSTSFSLSGVAESQHFVARDGEVVDMRRALRSDGSRCTVASTVSVVLAKHNTQRVHRKTRHSFDIHSLQGKYCMWATSKD